MLILTAQYKGMVVRYSIFSDNVILFNTLDVCRILGILKRPEGSVISHPWIRIAEIIETAILDDKDEKEFVDWLKNKFAGHESETTFDLSDIEDIKQK